MTVFTGTVVATMSSFHNPSAAEMETITDALHALTDVWTPYTPSWSTSGTAPTLGNGSLSGSYIQVGKFVAFFATLVIGTSTSIGTGTLNLGVPVASAGGTHTPMGEMTIFDSSAGTTFTRDAWQTSSMAAGFTDQAGNRVTTTVPMAPASNDSFTFSGVYQAQ